MLLSISSVVCVADDPTFELGSASPGLLGSVSQEDLAEFIIGHDDAEE